MNAQALPTLAKETGLMQDKTSGTLFGIYGGYNVCMVPDSRRNSFDIVLSVSRGGSPVSQADFQPLVNGCEEVEGCTVMGHKVTLTTKANTWSQKKCLQNAKTALERTVGYLSYNSFANCCQQCGSPDGVASYFIGGVAHLCPRCFGELSIRSGQKRQEEQLKAENVLGGAVGALLGSLLGVLSIVVLAQLGYVAVISGIIMAICTLKGYELLGGKLSTTGIIISVAIMALMVYMGDRVNWAIEVAKAFEMDFFSAFRAVHLVINSAGSEVSGEYTANLVLQYLYVALGAIPTVISNRKNKKLKSAVYALGSTVQR